MLTWRSLSRLLRRTILPGPVWLGALVGFLVAVVFIAGMMGLGWIGFSAREALVGPAGGLMGGAFGGLLARSRRREFAAYRSWLGCVGGAFGGAYVALLACTLSALPVAALGGAAGGLIDALVYGRRRDEEGSEPPAPDTGRVR